MPFKSKAQRRKFAQLLVEGKISPETFEEWSRETGSAELPEHAHEGTKKRAARKKSAKRSGKKSARKSAKKSSKKSAAKRGARKRSRRAT